MYFNVRLDIYFKLLYPNTMCLDCLYFNTHRTWVLVKLEKKRKKKI